MSAECDRAALARTGERGTGRRPWDVRAAFTAARRPDTELVPASAGAALKSKETPANSEKICFFRITHTSFAPGSAYVSPPFGGSVSGRSERAGSRRARP